MNAGIEHRVKQCANSLEYQHTQPQERALHYEISCKLWEVIGADIFIMNNKTLLCIADYYKFPIVKKVGSLSTHDLVQMAKLIFTEYGLPKTLFQMQAQTSHQRSSMNFAERSKSINT